MSVLRRNIMFLLVSQAATWSVTIILLILAPRRLGAEGFGTVQFVVAYVGFFNLIGSLGTYAHIVKSVARDCETLGPLVVSALRLKLLMGVVLSAAALALGSLLGYSGEVMTLIAVGCVGLILTLLNEMVIAGLAGMEQIARAAGWSTVQVYVSSLGGIVVLLTTQSLVAYVTVASLSWAVPLVANYRSLRPYLRGFWRRHPGAWMLLIRGGVPVFALTALNLVYGTIDIPILEGISGAEVVGWYSLAYRWIGMPIFITTIVVTAFLPQLSALANQAGEAFSAMTNRAIKFVLVVNIPAAVGLFFVASDLIDLLYGPSFEESVVLMRLLAVWVPLVAVNTVLATALVASDRHKRYIWVAATAAVFNPLLTIRAVHLTQDRYDNGAIGAAIVTVATEIFITVCALWMRRRGVVDRETVWYIARCVCAAAVMAGVLVLVRDTGIVLKVVVGAVAYGASSIAFRTLSWDEIKEGMATIRSRGRERPSTDGADAGAIADAGDER